MGAVQCLLSATAFGLMAVFAKLAYAQGVTLHSLLLIRFAMAAIILLIVTTRRGTLRALNRRAVLSGLAMGALGYAAQAGLYFAALTRADASAVALVFSIYPVLVMASAVLIGRERLSRRRVAALAIAMAGMILVLGGAPSGRIDLLGVLLALGATMVYTGYILIGDRMAAGTPPLALATLIVVGTFTTYAVSGAVRAVIDPAHAPNLRFQPMGWLWLGLLAVVSTVGAIMLFFAGLAKVGPSTAALLTIMEPVVTVASAAVVFGETLGLGQAVGGALVLIAVLVVQWPSGRAERDRLAAAECAVPPS